jgi:beta-lactamase class A
VRRRFTPPRLVLLAAALALLQACAYAPTTPIALPPPAATAPAPPPALAARIEALGSAFPGKVGIAVKDLGAGWVAAYDGDSLQPQQSVAKLWVALTVFDQVDRGRLALDRKLTVRRRDMSVFSQPMQKELEPSGRLEITVGDLLAKAISRSDNAADDILIRLVGGRRAVQATLYAKGIWGIRPGDELTYLESRLAGVTWRRAYSYGDGFYAARDRTPPALRAGLFALYAADPEDGASARAMVEAIGRLHAGELLSPASTARFLELLEATTTGPQRLKAGAPPGWRVGHKTGTGQDLGALTTGYNDVGIVTAPDGRAYAVAVMIGLTDATIPERQALMAAVTAAAAGEHDRQAGADQLDAAQR